MQQISIDAQIEKITANIAALPHQVSQAAALALNRTAEWLKGQVAKELSKEKRIKLKIIRDRIKIVRTNSSELRSLLDCDFKGVLARDLGSMKQLSVGASVAGQVFPGAFIATLRKGSKPGMYRRITKERFPVRSVRVPIIDEATAILSDLVGDEVAAVFEKRFEHEIKRITGII
jgi:hypothetical protein